MSQWLSPKGTVGKKAWTSGLSAGYSPQQMKVAIQQLASRGVGVNRGPNQFFHQGGPMKGVAGMHSPNNPLGKYQGPQGNLGIKAYTAARDSGRFNLADIPTLAGQGGMFLPSGASAQWNEDMEAMMAQQYEDQETPYFTAGSSEVGTSAMGVKTKKDPNASKTGGTSELKRKNFLINKSLNV